MDAFNTRDKIRDFYNVAFLLENYSENFTDDQIISFYERSHYKDLDEIALLLDDEIKAHKLLDYELNAEEFVINAMLNCEKILKQRQKKKTDQETKDLISKLDKKTSSLNNKIQDYLKDDSSKEIKENKQETKVHKPRKR